MTKMLRVNDYKEMIQEDIFDRSDMPQISTGDLDDAMDKLDSLGVDVEKGKTTPDNLKPSQKDIYKKKVKKIVDRTNSAREMKPLVISRDNYIVDGHHRWAALKMKFPNEKVSYFKIDLPIEKAVKVYNKIEDLMNKG